MKSTEVRLERLSKEYNRAVAVDNVSLATEPGNMIGLLGPSGCGKTTCLRMIAGLIRPTSGDVFVNDAKMTDVPLHRRNIGMLFQNYALFPHLTVEQNIAFGLEMRGIAKVDAAKKVADALNLVQLSSFGTRYPAQLSGGQQQRVALGRALVIEPAMLLVDELPAPVTDVLISIRPEAIIVEKAGNDTAAERPNGVTARVDQAIYRGFVSHYYLKTKSGEQIIAFEQNQSQRAGLRYAVG